MGKKLFVTIEARPSPEMVFDPPTIVGFFQNLGLTVENERHLLSLVQQHLSETELGATLIDIDDISVPDFDGDDADLADYRELSDTLGIWYVSGRAYYSDDEDEGEYA